MKIKKTSIINENLREHRLMKIKKTSIINENLKKNIGNYW